MINNKYLTLTALFFLSGCSSTFKPSVGMTLSEVSRESHISCLAGGKTKEDNIVYIGTHPIIPEVTEYKIRKDPKHSPKFQDYMDKEHPECSASLYFIDRKYVADNTIYEMMAAKQRKNDLIAEEEKRREYFHNALMIDIVKNRKLELLEYFKLTNRKYFKDKYDFKIYKDQSGNLTYLKDFLYVTKDKVADEIALYEEDMENIKIAEQKRIETQRIVEQERLERIRVANIEYENSLKKNEELKRQRVIEENAKNDLIYGKTGVAVRINDLVAEQTCIRERRDQSIQGQIFGFTQCTEYIYTGNLIVNISLRNNTSIRIKDPYVSCNHYTKTDTYINGVFLKSGDYVYEFLNPNEVVNSKILITNHERSASLKCLVKSYTNSNK